MVSLLAVLFLSVSVLSAQAPKKSTSAGAFLVGMGDTFDVAKMNAITVGKKGTMPAKMHHYAMAKGETIISVTAQGPFGMTYINPADDPQKAVTK